MEHLIKILKRAEKLNPNLLTKNLLLIPGYRDRIIKLILQQHDEGIDGDGEKLKSGALTAILFDEFYAQFTTQIKKSKGQPTDRVTLKDTGDFYKSHKVVQWGNGFTITADTLKDDTDLIEVWGEKILYLTDENIDKILDFSRDLAIEWTERYLFAA